MAEFADISVGTEWTNILVGIETVPTSFTIQNKGFPDVILATGAEPPATSTDGYVLKQGQSEDYSDETIIWARTRSNVVHTGTLYIGSIV